MKLKPCPFCGKKPSIVLLFDAKYFDVRCENDACIFVATGSRPTKEGAIEAWNRRAQTTIATEINLYDKEEIHHNCTVQVWTNTATGQTSIGWWPEGEPPTGAEDK